ncbi:MAG: hypothetical protein WCK69_02490, partial [Candidatus Saccharibacteria bacterium]
MNIQHPSTARTLSFSQKLLVLVFGSLFLTMALGLFAAQPAHAASGPSKCKITSGFGTQYGECATLAGYTPDEQAFFLALNDNLCYTLVIDSTKTPVRNINKVGCESDENFANIKKGSQTAADFKKCNEATNKNPEDNCVMKYINMAITFLSAGVGLVVIIMIIIGGIQYTSSSGDPQKVGAA